MSTTAKRTISARKTMQASNRACVPASVTVKRNNSARTINTFQRMITPEEMREEMKEILRTKESNRAFLREIGVTFKKNGQIEVKPI